MKKVRVRKSRLHGAVSWRRSIWLGALGLGVIVVALLSASPWLFGPRVDEPALAAAAAEDVRRQAEELIAHSRTAPLTLEQQRVKAEALASIKAPCGNGTSLAMRCCACNLGKSIAGLANQLVVREGVGAARVRQAVLVWLARTNPGGYSGAACRRNRCDRPFREDGCGGMKEAFIF